MFNPVAPYRYLLPNLYLSVADIANPDLLAFVGPGFISTSHAFMRGSASHPSGPHDWLAQKRYLGPHCWGREGSTQFAQGLPDHCDSYPACRQSRLEPSV